MSKYVLRQDQCVNFKKNTKGFCIWGQFKGALCFCKKVRVYCHLAVRRIPVENLPHVANLYNMGGVIKIGA